MTDGVCWLCAGYAIADGESLCTFPAVCLVLKALSDSVVSEVSSNHLLPVHITPCTVQVAEHVAIQSHSQWAA